MMRSQCNEDGATRFVGPAGVRRVRLTLVLIALTLPFGVPVAGAQWRWDGPGLEPTEPSQPGGNDDSAASHGDDTQPLQDSEAQAIQDLFRLGHAATQVMDEVVQESMGLTLEEERSLGREVHRAVMSDLRVSRSRARRARVERLIRPVLARRARKGIRYTITVVENEAFNAFSTLGGHIYVHTGLMDALQSDAALQFVLAHEVAHVDLKHCAANLTYFFRARQLGGDMMGAMAAMAHQVIKLGYSEAREYESDEWAYRTLRALGRSRSEALEGPVVLARIAGDPSGGRRSGKGRRDVESTVSREVRDHLRSHPNGVARLRRLRGLER